MEDLRDVFRGNVVMVAPIALGGGLRGKFVSALAQGCPVVTTSIGGEGFPEGERAGVFVRDDVSGMAALATDLLTNRELRRRTGANGRALVRRRFAPDLVCGELESLFYELVGSRPGENEGAPLWCKDT